MNPGRMTTDRRSDLTRVGRLKIWILVLTFIPSALFWFMDRGPAAAGLLCGGILVFLNLLGTQRTVILLVEGKGIENLVAVLGWFCKFGITAAVILGLLYTHTVDPLALLVGLGSLPLSLVFDIFLFPVNKGELKKS